MFQKGGKYTFEDTNRGDITLTGEQILDRFTVSDENQQNYLTKQTINIDHSLYETVKSYFFVGEEIQCVNQLRNFNFLWLDADRKLLLNEGNLDFDTIESKVFTSIEFTNDKNTNESPIAQITSPVYIFQNTEDKQVFDAYHPSLVKEAGTDKWKLFVKVKTNSGILDKETTLVVEGKTAKEAVLAIVKNAIFKTTQGQEVHSNMAQPLSMVRINNKAIYDKMAKYPMIIYDFILKEMALRAFWFKQEGENKILFHPHNMINFLPNATHEANFKTLFKSISTGLNKLTGLSYNISPDKFYHIHTTYLPDEKDILLTIHGQYEELYSDSLNKRLKGYSYRYDTNKKIKLGRKDWYKSISTLNCDDNSKNEQNEYKKVRKEHNAFIILKKDGNVHPIYRLSDANQLGNPFLGTSSYVHSCHEVNLAFLQTILGISKMDINHVEGKGVILAATTNQNCTLFCNDRVFDQIYNSGITDIQERERIKRLRNSITDLLKEDKLTPDKIKEFQAFIKKTVLRKDYNSSKFVYPPPKELSNLTPEEIGAYQSRFNKILKQYENIMMMNEKYNFPNEESKKNFYKKAKQLLDSDYKNKENLDEPNLDDLVQRILFGGSRKKKYTHKKRSSKAKQHRKTLHRRSRL